MKRLISTVLAALVSTSLCQNQLTVPTQQGLVSGTLTGPGVRQFLGIPYAVANRWQPPQRPPSHNKTFSAIHFGQSCVQQLSPPNLEFLIITGLIRQQIQESEQCLTLNIWAPSSNRKQKTAVMIWIYGGGFEFGTSNTTFYSGQTLVANHDDILLVSFNYRMNIFGFPNAPQLNGSSHSQNFGALDVEAAIQWVHDNIAAFGGDPNRITIFGQSAGAALASAYTFSHPRDTIVKGIIEQSGSLAGLSPLLGAFGVTFNPNAWNDVAKAVGCGNVSTPSQFTCMKAVPFKTLEQAVVSTENDFVPVQDGITFFEDVDSRSAAGNFLRVPLFVGNTAQEGDIFVAEAKAQNIFLTGNTDFESSVITRIVFNCPVARTAADYAAAGVPVWRYRYEAVFPDISVRSDLRAFHGSEIPLIFGTFGLSSFGPTPNNTEISLSKLMQAAWVAFARDPPNGLSNLHWPKYNPNTASLAQLGSSANQTGTVFTQGNSFDNCNVGLFEAGILLFFVLGIGIHI